MLKTSHKPQATSHKPQATSHKPFRLGFTLSELLVSLGVLGLIAGLTIPSVINSVNKARQKSMAKEALQVITDITSAGVLNGDFSTITSWDTVNQNGPTSITGYLTSKLNARQCVTSDITSPGCTLGWTGFPANGVDNQHNARWILPNGTRLQVNYYWGGFSSTKMAWTVDVNPYNRVVDYSSSNPDSMLMFCNNTDNLLMPGSPGKTETIKAGACGPADTTGPNYYSFHRLLGNV